MDQALFTSGPFRLTKDGWFKEVPPTSENGKWKTLILGGFINITERFVDSGTGKQRIILENGHGNTIIRDADILSTQKLPSLMAYGFNINQKYINDLGYALQLQQSQLPMSELYQGSGVIKTKKGIMISLDGLYSSAAHRGWNVLSEHNYDLKPVGTYEAWKKMFDDEVKGNLMLEMAVTMGVSALVTSYLYHQDWIDFSGIIYSLKGQSSTGKTSAAMLSISVAGNPNKNSNDETYTLFKGWNATQNALESYISNNMGIPVAFDELSTARFNDMTALLYSLVEGSGRQRANINGDAKQTKNWATSIISTSEYSIFQKSAKNDGLRVRTIELDETFTTSSDNAEALKLGVRRNYGHILPAIAPFLLNESHVVESMFLDNRKHFKNALNEECQNTGIRMIDRYAAFMTAADILNEVLKLSISVEDMKQYLISYHHDTVSERSLADKAIEIIVQFVAQNRGKFSENGKLANMLENYGLIALKEDHVEVKIIASVFKDMLKDNDFEDEKNVINALSDKGFVRSDKDRKSTKRDVKKNGKSSRIVFYHLILDREYASILDLSGKNVENVPSPFRQDKQHPLLGEMIAQANEWDKNRDIDL